MTGFPENVLTREQQRERADRVLQNLLAQTAAWDWECFNRRGQRLVTRTYSRMQSDLLQAKEGA